MNTIMFEAVISDSLQTLADILNYYIEHTTANFHTASLTAADMEAKVFFKHPRYQSFLVKDSAKSIIGYCIIGPWKEHEAYEHTGEVSIYLRHDCTAKGIGTLAIQHLESHARAHSITNLIACICSENAASIRLFEKAGFQHCAHFRQVGHKFGRALDTVYLQKILV